MRRTIHPTAEHGFRLGAERYAQSRPNYPEDIVFWLRNTLNLSEQKQVIDLASGTGKFTQYLKRITPHVTAIEPVEEMQAQFLKAHPELEVVSAFSDHVPLNTHAFDAVLSAQAFHWFAHEYTLKEMHRLLKPQGHLGLVWNDRDTSIEWVHALAELLKPFEQGTPRFYHQSWKKAFQRQPYFKLESEQHFCYVHTGTVEQVVSQRLLSTSFIALLPKTQQQALKQRFERIIFKYLGKHPQDTIEFPYITYAFHFQRLDHESA